jgi:hypothetical protein
MGDYSVPLNRAEHASNRQRILGDMRVIGRPLK